MRFSGLRAHAVIATVTLLGVIVVGGPDTAGASPLSWMQTPNPSGAFIPGLPGGPAFQTDGTGISSSVSCTGRRFCVAVGSVGQGGPTLTEQWDGTRWSVAPRSAVLASALTSVACVNERFCVAVGYSANGSTSPTTTLAEMWDGQNWSVPATPNRAGGDNQLNGVSCTSRTSCTAVGFSRTSTSTQTLIERWNGAAWSIVGSPNAGGTSSTLAGVSCGRGYCVAVGSSAAGGLIELWSGGSWTLGSAGSAGGLEAVSCVHPRFCMMSGGSLLGRWNGSSLSFLTSPLASPGFSADFGALSCVSSRFCVGAERLFGPTPGAFHSSEVTWDGTRWSTAAGAFGVSGALNGASCASTRFCFVVGGSGSYYSQGTTAVLGRA